MSKNRLINSTKSKLGQNRLSAPSAQPAGPAARPGAHRLRQGRPAGRAQRPAPPAPAPREPVPRVPALLTPRRPCAFTRACAARPALCSMSTSPFQVLHLFFFRFFFPFISSNWKIQIFFSFQNTLINL